MTSVSVCMAAIVTKGLSKVYKAVGKRNICSLDALGLSVEENEVYGFLGRNGAGKTTTIKILCGLLKPSAGEAFVFGENVHRRAARRLFGYLPEQPYFYEYLSPRETINFYGSLRGLCASECAREWEKLSELLDLGDIADEPIKGFSKGMRQRVGFAVALLGDPPLLILDEPMSGLDPVGRRHIRELMQRLRGEKRTLFFSSHVLGDVEQVCDRVGILVKGRLTRQGRIDDLLSKRENKVEVHVTGLNKAAIAALRVQAEAYRTADERDVFIFGSLDAANKAIETIRNSDGKLVEFNPLKETLEDYFMREQAAVASLEDKVS